MRPLRFTLNLTLDGCYDHTSVIPCKEIHVHATESFARADALIFGRITYQMMEEAWRVPGETGVKSDWMEDWMMPFARSITTAKKFVVSSTLKDVDWNSQLMKGDLKTNVQKLKEMPGKGLFVGGVKLAQGLTELGLIDEYEFVMHPRLVGRGPTLFAGLSKHVDLKLVDQRSLGSGLVALRYVKA